MTVRHQRRVAIAAAGTAVVVLTALWFTRWHVSRAMITVADPLVRSWLSNQVLASSDSVYQFTSSSVRFDPDARRISIDSINVTTDTVVNARLSRPHPVLTLRFTRCEITGIDVTGLAAGRGLHATHAGCDSVSMLDRTLIATLPSQVPEAQDADSNNFLRFQGKLNLPGILPFIGIDLAAFLHVHVAIDLLGSDGKRSTLSADSLAVELDSVRIDPREPVAKRRPLFSRDITVQLDRFAGVIKDGAHLSLAHFNANLEDGTCQLDSIAYVPSPGRRADSLGFAAISARHISLAGVHWRTFLLTGAVAVGKLSIDTARVRIVEAKAPHDFRRLPRAPKRLELMLRAIGRPVRLDSLAVAAVTLQEIGATGDDAATTTLRRLSLGHLQFGLDETSWASPFPIGRVTVTAEGVSRRTSGMNTFVNHLALDVATQRLSVDSLHSAPEGSEADFVRRHPTRTARLALTMAHIDVNGIDFPAFLRRGALRARTLDVRGLLLDVLIDKSKPDGPPPSRRTPQAVMHDAATEIQVDTVTGAGMVDYRERDPDASTPGTLTFGALHVRGYNFSTDPKRMSAATPFRLIGDAKLMGAGAMHVEWDIPLLSRDFQMRWHGTLGEMDPKAMNSFLPDAVGMRFTGGTFEGAEWSATVSQGVASGTLAPRWHDLRVSLPGVARGDSGVMGGIMRGFAKLAANTFGIRGDNTAIGGHKPIDSPISHKWLPVETLPDFIWSQLRDPLLLILKK